MSVAFLLVAKSASCFVTHGLSVQSLYLQIGCGTFVGASHMPPYNKDGLLIAHLCNFLSHFIGTLRGGKGSLVSSFDVEQWLAFSKNQQITS